MKALGLSLVLFGFAALAWPWTAAHAGVPSAHAAPAASRTFPRPPLVTPRGNWRAGNGWNCNPRQFVSGSYYAPSWLDYSGYPQSEASPVEAPPSSVVNNVFVETPAAEPPLSSLGPRLIMVGSKGFERPRHGPLVIYGDQPGPAY